MFHQPSESAGEVLRFGTCVADHFHCERSSSDKPMGEQPMLEHSPVLRHRSFWGGWAIEEEQCQKISGGHKALKFRLLLFL